MSSDSDDLDILEISVNSPNSDSSDIYNSEEVKTGFEQRQSALNDLLNHYDVERIIVPFDEPMALGYSEGIISKVKSEISSTYGDKYTTSAISALESFLNKEILGMYPYQNKKINWTGAVKPIESGTSRYNIEEVHAVEIWLMPDTHNEDYLAISVGLYGFTQPAKTVIENQESMLDNYDDLDDLSAAFTYHKGFSVPLLIFYDSLGRNLDIDISQADKWFKNNKEYPTGIYRAEEEISYNSSPFSMPLDPIFYPRPNEFGVIDFDDGVYLKGALNAKQLMHAYFEKILDKEFLVWESAVVNNLNFV